MDAKQVRSEAMIEKGMFLKCKTNTKNDLFGTVVWEVQETGLKAPELERADQKDGIMVIMLGGSGPSARAGMVCIDSEWHIQRDVSSGITQIFAADQREAVMEQLNRIPKVCAGTTPAAAKDRVSSIMMGNVRHGGSGVVEIP